MRIDPDAITWTPDREHPALWMVWYRGVPLDRVLPLFAPDTPADTVRSELALWIGETMAPLSHHQRRAFLAGRGRPDLTRSARWDTGHRSLVKNRLSTNVRRGRSVRTHVIQIVAEIALRHLSLPIG